MMITTIDELLAARLGDYRLLTISWVYGGENLIAFLSKASSGLVLRLAFVWATEVHIELDFGESFGEPLLFDATFTPTEGGSWNVNLDFAGAPRGSLSLSCNDILVKTLQKEECAFLM